MKHSDIIEIIATLRGVLAHVDYEEKRRQSLTMRVNDIHTRSAANLINYISLRSFDIRDLQCKLGGLGMSRLARSETHVKASLKIALYYLNGLVGEKGEFPTNCGALINESEKIMDQRTEALLGKTPFNRRLRIMVTMPSKADYELVEKMIGEGMDCARINCAHDTSGTWLDMIENIKKAGQKLKKRVIIAMDLGGPKIRTGEIQLGPRVKSFTPKRDAYGKVIHPAVIRLVLANKKKIKSTDLPVVEVDWLTGFSVGDAIHFEDTRHKKRTLKVISVEANEVTTHCFDSVYVKSGLTLKTSHGETTIGEVPPIIQAIFLKKNDELILHKQYIKGQPTQYSQEGTVLEKAHISCTLPEVFDYIQIGDTVFFDDGKITAVIIEKRQENVLLKITQTKSGGGRLRADKGINFPDSNLGISGLTEKDKVDLAFVVKHADIANFSYVNTQGDVTEILSAIEALGAKDRLGIILKIESQRGYDNLSKIVLEAMSARKVGVMIARGDLAIEAGWKRMGSIQKEILAICSAGHIPVVWATQVLENLSKKGLPSRSEITDAVNATKADCVMLNKGMYALEAIRLLNKIIESSEAYQNKNAPMLPRLEKIIRKENGEPQVC